MLYAITYTQEAMDTGTAFSFSAQFPQNSTQKLKQINAVK
jgi:hypothetical protein